MPLKIGVVGATGPTGLQVIEQALTRGHEVVAIVRSPQRLGQLRDRPGVTVKQMADISSDPDGRLGEALAGCQVLVSSLGATASLSRVDLMTQAAPVLAAGMRTAGINRLVLVSSMYTVDEPEHPFMIRWVIRPLFLARNLDDLRRAETYLTEKCSDFNFTIVKPPRLSDGPLVERHVKAVEGQFVPGSSEALPRANLAKFVLDCAEKEDAWSRKLVAIQF